MAKIGLSHSLEIASRRHLASGECGFTMVEMLMALFILAIGLLGLASLQMLSTSQSGRSRLRGAAALAAHSLLDQIQAEGSASAAMRAQFGAPTVPPSGFQFIQNPTNAAQIALQAGPQYTILGLLPDDPYYTNNPKAAKNILFTTTWGANAGTVVPMPGNPALSMTAVQEFIVNVYWDEYNPQSKTADKHYLTVSRYVRI